MGIGRLLNFHASLRRAFTRGLVGRYARDKWAEVWSWLSWAKRRQIPKGGVHLVREDLGKGGKGKRSIIFQPVVIIV